MCYNDAVKRVCASAIVLTLLAGGCASAPIAEPPAESGDSPISALQTALDQALALEPALARRYGAVVIGAEENGSALVFTLDLTRQASFGREAHDLQLVTTCSPGAFDECAQKAVAAIRAAERL